jgi:predicted porin
MNKKVMAVAVASVLAAPAALAQTSNVQLYGRAVLGVDHYEADDATIGSAGDYKGRLRVFDNSSRVGLRGTEDLGNGLKAIFQIETGVNIDSGSQASQSGAANASSGFWASRDSFVGLDSNFGRLTFGRQSIWWANGVNAQSAANYINTEIPWANGTQLGRISRATAGAGPVARQSNTVQYTTPTMAGLNATLSWSPNAQEAVQGDSAAGTDTDGRVWGITVRGEWGPFYAQVDYADNENNKGNAAGAVQAEWTGWKVGGSWGYMPGARIGVIYTRSAMNNLQSGSLGDDVNQSSWAINWEHTFGNFQVLAMYGWTSDIKSCDFTGASIPSGGPVPALVSCSDTDAKGWMIGGRYFLSKRTWLFASYNAVKNNDNNFADYTGGGITSVSGTPTTAYGADPRIWAFGVFHNF